MVANIKERFKSVRVKLFMTLCITTTIIITFLIIVNSFVLEFYYIYSKEAMLLSAYQVINDYYNGKFKSSNIELDLEKMSFSNDFDILIKTTTGIYTTSKDFISSLTDASSNKLRGLDENILHSDENVEIKKMVDKKTEMSFILLSANLDNGYQLYIRVAIASIQASVKIANKFLMLMGCITIIVSGMIVLVISRKFTSPIEELNEITTKISELDFSQKYEIGETEDEINNLRKKYKFNV
ncbi:MAG: cell wall metabolism sensor histidine kinase WalK [Clostridia bacterium]|nr:cell wall metabolism sensor histidine kinase WalK [Clostridia bacterium]